MLIIKKNNIYLGDNLDLLKKIKDNSIDSVVSDFPYNLSFMGKKWDTIQNYQEWCYERAKELLRVLKPGGYCLIFGGTRTHHRLVCAFEDAGFEIKDEISWIYAQGFPKSYNISKGFDKKAGAKRKVIGVKNRNYHAKYKTISDKKQNGWGELKNMRYEQVTSPSTDLAKQWDGWGTSLKPAHEPIMVAQKPREGTYCNNIEKWGVGGLNIDDSRVKYKGDNDGGNSYNNSKTKQIVNINNQGRFPANVIFDEKAGQILDEQSGVLKSGNNCIRRKEGSFFEHGGLGKPGDIQITYGDSGGASRFFYCPKANKKDKTENGKVENNHPTVKPTDLIKYLIRLVTPPNGTCLDICEGSGTHAKACILLTNEGYPVNYIGFEKEEEYFDIARKRIEINLEKRT